MTPETISMLVVIAILFAVVLGLVITRGNQLARLRRTLAVDTNGELEAAARRALEARSTAELERDQSAEDLAQLVDLLSAGIVRVDDRLRVRLANRRAHELLRRAPGATIGAGAIEAFADHRVEEVIREAAQIGMAHGEAVLGGGEGPIVLVRARRAADDGVWIVLEDVTELRRLQRIRAEFIDNLSHELRTPLTTVRLLTETLARDLERTDTAPRIRNRVAKIDVETGHLVQMVNELLDLARIEGGATELHLEDVEIGKVISASVDRLQLFADRQRVRLTADLSDESGAHWVRADPERLGQLLINLLHNAVKFSAAGGEVTVRTRAAGEEVIMSVEDRGIGIPRADLARVFERFYKVDKARVRGAGGTGLGLAIAKHIAEGHGGRIWVESEEGRGSTFSVALPRAHAAVRG